MAIQCLYGCVVCMGVYVQSTCVVCDCMFDCMRVELRFFDVERKRKMVIHGELTFPI